jgi:dephospho-CoA kinase
VLDADKVCHNLLFCDEIKEAFKDLDIFDNSEISREKFGKLVFANPELKQKLEDILYPMVKIKIAEFFEQYSA